MVDSLLLQLGHGHKMRTSPISTAQISALLFFFPSFSPEEEGGSRQNFSKSACLSAERGPAGGAQRRGLAVAPAQQEDEEEKEAKREGWAGFQHQQGLQGETGWKCLSLQT